MSRSLVLACACLLSVTNAAGFDPRPATEDLKLEWMSPCSFAYTDGSPLSEEHEIAPHQCYYMLAHVEDAVRNFNQLPTFAAQVAFLKIQLSEADAAMAVLRKKVGPILAATDPARSPRKGPSARLKQLLSLRDKVFNDGVAACEPFLWPQRDQGSYIQKAAGKWPSSWDSCFYLFDGRYAELSGLISEQQNKVVDSAARRIARLARTPGASPPAPVSEPAREEAPASKLQLDRYFDNGGLEEPDVPSAPEAAPTEGLARQAPATSKAPAQILPIPPVSMEREQRNYFGRGHAAGLKRLKDEGLIALRHSIGASRTIGDPYGKASLTFFQKGDTCAIASQYQALRARNVATSMEELTREGFERGYYFEYTLAMKGRDGGTFAQDGHRLLLDHGITAAIKVDASPADLLAAIGREGDAIVSMNTRRLWNDSSVPETSGHRVYVTGAEADKKGRALGFYINDTGTGEAARFLPIADFERAWSPRGRMFVDIRSR